MAATPYIDVGSHPWPVTGNVFKTRSDPPYASYRITAGSGITLDTVAPGTVTIASTLPLVIDLGTV